MKLRKILIPAIAAGLAANISAQGTWQLIDNFDDNNLDGWMTHMANNIVGYEPWQEDGDEAYLVLINPEGYEDNAALHYESGGYGYPDQYGSAWALVDLPAVLDEPVTTTLYFQYYQQGGSNEFHMGLSAVEKDFIPQEDIVEPVTQLVYAPAEWGDYSLLFRVAEDNVIDIRTGSDYRKTDFVLDSYTWYEFWLVAHNNDGDYGDEQGDTWELYVRGGQWEDPTLVPVPPDQPFDNLGNPNPPLDYAIWRNPTTEPLRHVIYASQTGPPDSPNDGDPHLIDDLYYLDGESIERPAGATVRTNPNLWNGYQVFTSGGVDYADTGSFLGMIALDPDSSYVYSYDLNSWVWADSALVKAGGGGYVYIFK